MPHTPTRPIRIFISVPDDLAPERDVALATIQELNTTFQNRFELIPFPYQDGNHFYARAATHFEANQYVLRPDYADIYICMLWLRMGKMTAVQSNPETDRPYPSFLEYEFMTAYRAARARSRPKLLVYRCNRALADMRALDVTQYGRVQKLFDRFENDPLFQEQTPIRDFLTANDLKKLLQSDLEKLLNDLQAQSEVPADATQEAAAPKPILLMPIDLPKVYIPRKEALTDLRLALLGSHRKVSIIPTPMTLAMLGHGKTVLARAICDDPAIRAIYPDGVLWATIGSNLDLTRIQRDWIKALGGDIAAASNPDDGTDELKRLLHTKSMLLILDDVRSAADSTALDVGGTYCKVLITARDRAYVKDTLSLTLGSMLHEECIDLLVKTTEGKVTDMMISKVSQRLSSLPLGLKILGAILAAGSSWTDLIDSMENNDLHFDNHPHGSLLSAVKVSVDNLQPHERSRYHELAIFPDGEAIIEPVVSRLWSRTSERDGIESAALLKKLRDQMLIQEDGTLHEIHREYLHWAVKPPTLPSLHAILTSSYDEIEGTDFPKDDGGYAWRWLVYHFAKGGRLREARALLTNGTYLKTKIAQYGTSALLQDFAALPPDDPLQQIAGALRLGAQILDRNPNELSNQLYGRLGNQSNMHDLVPVTGVRLKLESRTLTPPDWPLLRALRKHTFWATSCAFSPDGLSILSASADKTMRLWDVETGKSLRIFRGHTNAVNTCALNTDGQLALSGSADMTLQLWSVETGKTLRTMVGHTDAVNGCALSADGQIALSASADNTLRVWNTHRAQTLHVLTGHTGLIHSCAMSGDGRTGISASADGTLRVWDFSNGEVLSVLEGHNAEVLGCALSADGRLAVSVSADHMVQLWDVNLGERLLTLEGHTHWVLACALSADNRRALTASLDNTLRLWDVESGRTLRILRWHSALTGCTLSPDGRVAASTSSDKSLQLWDTDVSQLTADTNLEHAGHRDLYSPDGKSVLSVAIDHAVRLWDANTKQITHHFKGHNKLITACRFSPDGRFVLTASGDTTMRLWDTESGANVSLMAGHTAKVSDCAFSPDGFYAISASADKTLRLWNVKTGAEITRWYADIPLISCAFNTDACSISVTDQHGNLHFLRLETA